MKKLAVLAPMYGGMCSGTFHRSMMQLMAMAIKTGLEIREIDTFNESLIPRGRNRLVDDFLKTTSDTHAVFIDADIGFDPNDILQMLDLDLDVIGVPCVKKSVRWDRIITAAQRGFLSQQDLEVAAGDFVMNFKEGVRQIDLAQLQEMSHMGTGILMIKREVFKAYKEAYPDRWYVAQGDPSALPGKIWNFFRTDVNPKTHDYDSEDYAFCMDVAAIGFKIWMIPWVKTTHWGNYLFKGDLCRSAEICGGL